MISDDARAANIREKWLKRAHSFDTNIATPQLRERLSVASWNDETFANQRIGLLRALNDCSIIGLKDSYAWTLSRSAYDFITEPLYQYLILCSLNGASLDAAENLRTVEVFGNIVARVTNGWTLRPFRAEPTSADVDVGWVTIPFAWDDLLQLGIAGWLQHIEIGPTTNFGQVCRQLTTQTSQDMEYSGALPYWNGLIAKAIAGMILTPSTHEALWVSKLLTEVPQLHLGILHQSATAAQDLGNTLAHLAMAYTVGHEVGHLLEGRFTSYSGKANSDPLERELAADQVAMMSSWNYGGTIEPHVRNNQSFELLWCASGLFFYIGLLLYHNTLQVVAEMGPSPRPDDHVQNRKLLQMTKTRFRTWLQLAGNLCEALAQRGRPEAAMAMSAISRVLPSLVAYSNAYLDHCRTVVPAVMKTVEEMKVKYRIV